MEMAVKSLLLAPNPLAGQVKNICKKYGGSLYVPSPTSSPIRNLLTYTEQFDNAAWTKSNVSINTNTITAPDGSLTADKVIESATSATHAVLQNVSATSSTVYNRGVFVKAGERVWAYIRTYDGVTNTGAWFNVSTGVLGTVESGVTATIRDVGNGWFRCSVARQTGSSATAERIQIQPASGDSIGVYAGDGTSGIYIWGAQLEVGDTATAYQGIAASGTPLVADLPGSCFQDSAGTIPAYVDSPVGYLKDLTGTNHATQATAGFKPILRGKVKNLLTYSEQFDNAAWLKAASGTGIAAAVTANAGVAPDGTTTADRVVLNLNGGTATTDTSTIYQSKSIIANTAWNISVYLKSNTGSTYTVRIRVGNASYNATVTPEWQRFNTGTANTSSDVANPQILLRGAFGTSDYADILAWGAQLEVGTTANAYIKTESATASSSYGPYWLDFDGTDDRLDLTSVPFQMTNDQTIVAGLFPTAVSKYPFGLAAGGASESLPAMAINASGYLGYEAIGGGTTVSAFDTVTSVGTNIVAAVTKIVNAISVRKNSTQVATGTTSGTYTTATNARIGAVGRTTPVVFTGGQYFMAILAATIPSSALIKLERYAAKLSGAQL